MIMDVSCFKACLLVLCWLVCGVLGQSDVCSPDPCIYGTCETYLDTYRCDCVTGAIGRNCEQAPDFCSYQPCFYGTCTNLVNASYFGYRCDCETGYTGEHCDIELDPCAFNPCGFGSCVKLDQLIYKCTCNEGYTGDNCLTVIDHCTPNQCVHGRCENRLTGFTCTCDRQFTGKYCNQFLPPTLIGPDQINITVSEGNAITLNCSIDGAISWFWRKEGEGILQNDTRSITLTSMEIEDGGLYICSAINPSGTEDVTYNIMVQYKTPELLGADHVNVTVTEGDDLALYCYIPRASEWHWSKIEGNGRTNVSELGGTLYDGGQQVVLTSVTVTDTGVYVCSASNPAGTVEEIYNVEVKSKVFTTGMEK